MSPRSLFLLLLLSRAASDSLKLSLVSGTTCLDGTLAGYYYTPPPHNTTKWVVFFEGGGACYSQSDCAARAQTALGSSKQWPSTFEQDDNVLSSDAKVNPMFFDAHHVYIPYCTGDVHSGTRSSALNSSWPFYFSGHVNVGKIVHALSEAHASALGAAETLLVSGSSAGGIGAFLNVDYLASLLPASVTVRAAPQGGWFFPPVSIFPAWSNGQNVPIWSTFGFAYTELYASYAPPACVAAHNGSYCGSVDNYSPFVKSPCFVGENLVDSQQVFAELLAPPTSPQLPAFKTYYHQRMNASLYAKAASRAGWGVWAPACFDHTDDIKLQATNATVVSGVSYRDALTQWISGVPMVLIDSCADPVPCNPSCPPVKLSAR